MVKKRLFDIEFLKEINSVNAQKDIEELLSLNPGDPEYRRIFGKGR